MEAASCPITSITAKSIVLVEQFRLWTAGGRVVNGSLYSLLWQAFSILLREERKLKEHAW